MCLATSDASSVGGSERWERLAEGVDGTVPDLFWFDHFVLFYTAKSVDFGLGRLLDKGSSDLCLSTAYLLELFLGWGPNSTYRTHQ